jgi:hypothetical protein
MDGFTVTWVRIPPSPIFLTTTRRVVGRNIRVWMRTAGSTNWQDCQFGRAFYARDEVPSAMNGASLSHPLRYFLPHSPSTLPLPSAFPSFPLSHQKTGNANGNVHGHVKTNWSKLMTQHYFEHQKLDVYRISIEFVSLANSSVLSDGKTFSDRMCRNTGSLSRTAPN